MAGKYKKASQLKNDLMQVYPIDDEFTAAFARKSMSTTRQNSEKAKYILGSIEKHCSSGKSPTVENVTLEHVLPYTPDDSWQEYFAVNDYEEAIDRLGNMALLPDSANLAQQSFADKSKVLAESGYTINEKLASYKDWDMDNLCRHQEWLAKQAKSVWEIP